MGRKHKGRTTPSGILPLVKPKDIGSAHAVAKVRSRFKLARVGHCGTLDPFASGVLPLAINEGTKLVEYLMHSRKTYRADMLLGCITDTQDVTGAVLEERPVAVNEDAVREAIEALEGEQWQTPPMYSAKKIEGKKLYNLARKGREVEREPVRILVENVRFLEFEDRRARFEATVSAGTYIRTLCHDLGLRLGCGATCEKLVRTASSGFSLEDCIDLEYLLDEGEEALTQALVPLEAPSLPLPRLMGGMRATVEAVHGRPIPADDVEPLSACEPEQRVFRLLDAEHRPVALVERAGENWKVVRGFRVQ